MFKLYDYQEKIVSDVFNKFKEGKRAILVQSPAGSGKSIIMAELARRMTAQNRNVLFIVHRQEIVEQIQDEFSQQEVNMDHCICTTVVKAKNRLLNSDNTWKPDLILTDETHHSRAKTYQKIYHYFPYALRVGFTATPWRLSGKGFEDIYEDLIIGPSVSWLIRNKHLAPFKYYSERLIDTDDLSKASTGDYTTKSITQEVNRHQILGDVVESYKKFANDEQTILYAHDVDYSKKIVKRFQDNGINAEHCDSTTPAKDRDRIMNDFREGRIKILSNVDLISEGFDVPDCSCVILLRPTASLVIDVQQSMRCMRYKPNKIAKIIDLVGNYKLFGLPDTPRKWSLKDRPKPKGGGMVLSPYKECQYCQAVIGKRCVICPECGERVFDIEEVDKQMEALGEFFFITNYSGIKVK